MLLSLELTVDLVGNIQPLPTSFTWEVDQTPPSVWSVQLPPLLINTVTFNLSVTWSEELSGLWLSIDGSPFEALTVEMMGRTLAVRINIMTDGAHVLALKGWLGVYSTSWFILFIW
jgi:hypothetical protein